MITTLFSTLHVQLVCRKCTKTFMLVLSLVVLLFCGETPKEIKYKLDPILLYQTGIGSNMTKRWSKIAAMFREETTLTALQIPLALPRQTYTIYHYLTLSHAKSKYTHTLTVFTPKSLDLPCSGMPGISHLIRYNIYIEHEAFLRAIMGMGMWTCVLTHTHYGALFGNNTCTCARPIASLCLHIQTLW